jgi:DNA repair exonuclease SbcCD ATPase subunit
MNFDNLSGGERVKVSVAITEALGSLQKCGFRLCDEFVTALDQNSLEGFMDSVEHLQKNYPQLLMISHIQEIKDLFEKTLTIKKHNGISIIS